MTPVAAARPWKPRSVDLGGRDITSLSRYRFIARQIRGLLPLWRTLSVCRVETPLDAWGSSAPRLLIPLSRRLLLHNAAPVSPVHGNC